MVGPTGPTGPVGVITGSVSSVADLPETGNPGDMYLVNGELYVWNEETGGWENRGDLHGPTGATGATGAAGEIEEGEMLFEISTATGTASVGYGESLVFESSSLDITVSENPTTINIENKPLVSTIQISSINATRVEAGGDGSRWGISAVGLGYDYMETTAAATDPVTLSVPSIALKIYESGTITEIRAAFTLSVSQTDAATAVHMQLYYAPDHTSTQFQYIPNTDFLVGNIPNLSAEGTYRTAEISGLSIPVAENSQIIAVFYCTSTLLAGTVAYFSAALKFEK